MSLHLGDCDCPLMVHCRDWIISGGESGGGARALDPRWVRKLIADCHRRGVAVFHKQWGTYQSRGNDGSPVRQGNVGPARKAREDFGR
jgi:protein gp37